MKTKTMAKLESVVQALGEYAHIAGYDEAEAENTGRAVLSGRTRKAIERKTAALWKKYHKLVNEIAK
jgi:hypothetical protein